MTNPLISDRDVDFLLYEVLDAEQLCALPFFAEHTRDTFSPFIDSARRLARTKLYPSYRRMDVEPPQFVDGTIRLHADAKKLYPRIVDLGLLNATRPESVGGVQMPNLVTVVGSTYLMAANLSMFGFVMLTNGAAHLIEEFGDEFIRTEFMQRMYDGEWTGTMALTEPQAGSSLADVTTTAAPAADGTYRIKGSKIFISGGDHDLAPNVVHMTLARIEGAPAGTRGISLFAVPKMRLESGELVANDLHTTQMIHKIGWRGLPSLALNYGDNGDCHGWLVGEPHKGLRYMFQMMNSARLWVGAHGVATASVAYHESLQYARDRKQGREAGVRDPEREPVAIIEHADVRRMLLKQKAIVEGGLALVAATARYLDIAEHGDGAAKQHAETIVGLLTPVAKSFPAERGFESNALAVQIHGGYGYTSEYLPESWLRDQKLNSIHEGTTGIQGLDLLGRKVMGQGGAALRALVEEVETAAAKAADDGVDAAWCEQMRGASRRVAELTMGLGQKGLSGDVAGMLLHSTDYLEMFSTWVVAWQWLVQAAAAKRGLGSRPDDTFYAGKLAAAQYWFANELPRVGLLADRCAAADDSYARMQPEWF